LASQSDLSSRAQTEPVDVSFWTMRIFWQ
jgi:hypothetical protein